MQWPSPFFDFQNVLQWKIRNPLLHGGQGRIWFSIPAEANMATDIEIEIKKLRNKIRSHDQKYYVDASPLISDLEYDRMMERLRHLESENPMLIVPDSPTQRVGEQPVDYLDQVSHRVPMLSIENTYSLEELHKFGERVSELLDGDAIEWIVELKIDGVAASLIYENGVLTRALTRGNGAVGDDITHNIRTLQGVPLKLTTDSPPEVLEVRGEVYMNNRDLVLLNERQAANGESLFKNTRNVAAGTIRLLDPRICAQRNLRMFSHGIGHCEGLVATNHMDFLKELGSYGLSPTPFVECFSDFTAAASHCEVLINRIPELDFEIDGIVLKVNRFDQRQTLGTRSKSPRWIVAYKWEKYEAVTTVHQINVQVGKTGAITPVAELEPVQLAGTTVSRASLHNAEEIQRLDVRLSDTVVVEKAGKIIPHIVRVEKHHRKPGAIPFAFPTRCPACDSELHKDEDGVYIRCLNRHCEKKIMEQIRYFASRDAMDIEGLGEKVVEQLVATKRVRAFGDLYRLTVTDIESLDRMGEKSAKNLVVAINESRSRGLGKLLNALSIRHVGKTVASILARFFGTMEAIVAADLESLVAVDEVGGIIAESLFEYIHSDAGREVLADLTQVGVNMESTEFIDADGGVLAGKIIVVTGTLTRFTRTEVQGLIEMHSGKVSSSISSKTDFLVAGDKAGSKLSKAKKLGVRILSEEEFENILK
ncbi:MAG: NAD-dependent DNA ligase LigA [Pirellulaceae bacterium]|nr:NAD-dependent DNA ligase LigA [Pirellulaceae bacterium]